MLTLAFLLFACFAAVRIYLYQAYTYWRKRKVPGPKVPGLLGHIPDYLFHKRHLIYQFAPIYDEFKERYNFVGIYVLRQPQILLTSPEAVKEVLIKNFKCFRDNFFSEPVTKNTDKLLGRNPFNLKGDEWKDKRSELTPGFAVNKVKAEYASINDISEKLNRYIDNQIQCKPGVPIEIHDLSARFTADAVSSAIYGLDTGSFETEESTILSMGRNFIHSTPQLWYYLALIAFFPPINKLFKATYVDKKVEDFFIQLMNDSLKLRMKNGRKQNDYLDYLLEIKEKKGLKLIDLAANGTTFFLDGFDTSSILMFHTLYEIAKNIDVQERLRQEINEIFERDGKFSYDNIEEMTYLEQVINESARINPPITMAVKLCTENTKLALDDKNEVEIEKGTIVNVPIYCIHKDERLFPEPNRFDPDRFASSTKDYREKCWFLPFGDGPRICIGMRFALAQVKRGIIEIIKHYRISVHSKTQEPLIYEPKAFLFISTSNDVFLNFEKI